MWRIGQLTKVSCEKGGEEKRGGVWVFSSTAPRKKGKNNGNRDSINEAEKKKNAAFHRSDYRKESSFELRTFSNHPVPEITKKRKRGKDLKRYNARPRKEKERKPKTSEDNLKRKVD